MTNHFNTDPHEPRFEAELDEETGTVLPPSIQLDGDVPAAILAAVEDALKDEPNACNSPHLIAGGDADHHRAMLVARYNEMPVVTDDGELEGWVAPYRFRERFDAALRAHLPAGVAFEAKNNSATVFYAER